MDKPNSSPTQDGIIPTSDSTPVGARKIRYFGRTFRLISIGLITLLIASCIYLFWRHRQFSTHLEKARLATVEGRNNEALRQLRICEEIDSSDRKAMLLAGRVFRMMQSWQRAEEVLDQYWHLYGDDEELTFERLLQKAAKDDTDQVAGLLRVRMSEGDEKALFSRHAIVSGYLREFRHHEAESVLTRWFSERPDDPLARLLLGKLHEQLFKYNDAIETYAVIVSRNPDHTEARLKLALVLMQQRQADAALIHLQMLRESMPDSTEVAVQWALALRQVGRTDEAVRALDDALERFPNSSEALLERGTIALNAGDDELAVELLSKSVRINPGQVGGFSLRAQALTRLGKLDEAAEDAKRIKLLNTDSDRLTVLINGPLQTRPNDPSPPFEIAGIALRAGHPAEAIHWYQTALKRNPNHGPSHSALAVIYHEMGNPVLATQHRALAARSEGKQ